MAQVKYGGGIVDMRGSIAGNTHARNRFGNYVRARTKPVNPKSDRQVAARLNVAFLAEMWHEDLDDTQRGSWDNYAAAIAMQNRLGETIHLTGFNHFIRSNAAALMYNRGLLSDAPTILSLPETDPQLACSEEDIAGQTFTFVCGTTGWHPNTDAKTQLGLYQGRPMLDGRNFFAGPWRYMDYIDPTEGAAGTATVAAAFTFALGQKVWFQARIMTSLGRLTNLWSPPPRTIIADV